MSTPVDPYLEQLAELCRRYRIKRLELFGSAAQGRFDPEKSDFDFLVEYDRSDGVDILEQYFGFRESLEALLGRKVDVVEESLITNPYFRDGVNRARKVLYDACPPKHVVAEIGRAAADVLERDAEPAPLCDFVADR